MMILLAVFGRGIVIAERSMDVDNDKEHPTVMGSAASSRQLIRETRCWFLGLFLVITHE